ncbi:hypothetical protein D3C71_1592840 [compost metagenome]
MILLLERHLLLKLCLLICSWIRLLLLRHHLLLHCLHLSRLFLLIAYLFEQTVLERNDVVRRVLQVALKVDISLVIKLIK